MLKSRSTYVDHGKATPNPVLTLPITMLKGKVGSYSKKWVVAGIIICIVTLMMWFMNRSTPNSFNEGQMKQILDKMQQHKLQQTKEVQLTVDTPTTAIDEPLPAADPIPSITASSSESDPPEDTSSEPKKPTPALNPLLLSTPHAPKDQKGMIHQARMLCTLVKHGVQSTSSDPSSTESGSPNDDPSQSARCKMIGLNDEILSPSERVLRGEPEAHSFLVEVRDNTDLDGGTVIVTHESCEDHVSAHPMLYPSSPALSALLTERFGPDLIELRIIGPEIQTIILEPLLSESYLRSSSQQPNLAFSCTYSAKFSILISGIYDMYLHLIHTKFEAFRFFPSQHPRPQNGLLVHVADKFIRATPVKELIRQVLEKKKRNELSIGDASKDLMETVPLPPGSDPSLKPKPFGVRINLPSSSNTDDSPSLVNSQPIDKHSPFYKAILKLFEGDYPIWGYGTTTKWIRNDTTLAKAFIQERTLIEPFFETATVRGSRGKIAGYRNVVKATERYGFGGCSTLTPSNTPHSDDDVFDASPDSSFHPLADLNFYRAFSILQWSTWDEFSVEAMTPQSSSNTNPNSIVPSGQGSGSTPLPPSNPLYFGQPTSRKEAFEWLDYVEDLYVNQGIEFDVHSFPTRGRVDYKQESRPAVVSATSSSSLSSSSSSLHALYSSAFHSETLQFQLAHASAGIDAPQTLAQDLIAVDLDTFAMQSEFLSCGKERTILFLGDQGMASIYESMVRLILGDASYTLPPFVGQSPPGGVDDATEPTRYPGMECHQASPLSSLKHMKSSSSSSKTKGRSSINPTSDSPILCFIYANSFAQLKANPIKVQKLTRHINDIAESLDSFEFARGNKDKNKNESENDKIESSSKGGRDVRLANGGMNKRGQKQRVSDADLKEAIRHGLQSVSDPSITSSSSSSNNNKYIFSNQDPSMMMMDKPEYDFIPFLDLIARTRLQRNDNKDDANGPTSSHDTIDHIFFSWDSAASKMGTSFESFTSDLASFIDWVESDDIHRWGNDLNEMQRFNLQNKWPKFMEDPFPMDGIDLNMLEENAAAKDDKNGTTKKKKQSKLIHTQLTHVASFTHPRIYNPPPNFASSISDRRTIQTLGLYLALAEAILSRNHVQSLSAGFHASHMWIDNIQFEIDHQSIETDAFESSRIAQLQKQVSQRRNEEFELEIARYKIRQQQKKKRKHVLQKQSKQNNEDEFVYVPSEGGTFVPVPKRSMRSSHSLTTTDIDTSILYPSHREGFYIPSPKILGVTIAEILTHLKKVLNHYEKHSGQQSCSSFHAQTLINSYQTQQTKLQQRFDRSVNRKRDKETMLKHKQSFKLKEKFTTPSPPLQPIRIRTKDEFVRTLEMDLANKAKTNSNAAQGASSPSSTKDGVKGSNSNVDNYLIAQTKDLRPEYSPQTGQIISLPPDEKLWPLNVGRDPKKGGQVFEKDDDADSELTEQQLRENQEYNARVGPAIDAKIAQLIREEEESSSQSQNQLKGEGFAAEYAKRFPFGTVPATKPESVYPKYLTGDKTQPLRPDATIIDNVPWVATPVLKQKLKKKSSSAARKKTTPPSAQRKP